MYINIIYTYSNNNNNNNYVAQNISKKVHKSLKLTLID